MSQNTTNRQYILAGKLEILAELNSLLKDQRLIQIRAEGSDAALLSTLLEVRREQEQIVLDSTQDANLRQKLCDAPELHFQVSDGGIHIRFRCGPAQDTLFERHAALLLPMPRQIIRLQRREAFRVELPPNHGMQCTIPRANGPIALKPIDISASGIGASDSPQQLDDPVGTFYRACRLQLPEGAVVEVDLRLVRVHQFTRGDKTFRVCGFRFQELNSATQRAIQQAVNQLERAALARKRGFG